MCIKANLGVSALSAIPYSINLIFNYEVGNMTIALHGTMLVFWIIIDNKNFKVYNLLGFLFAILFGKFITVFNYLVNLCYNGNVNIVVSFILLFIGILLIAYGTYLYLSTNFVAMPIEGCIRAISQKLNKSFGIIKLLFDLFCTGISIILCFVFLGNLGSIGIGTVLTAIFVGPIINVFKNKKFLKRG